MVFVEGGKPGAGGKKHQAYTNDVNSLKIKDINIRKKNHRKIVSVLLIFCLFVGISLLPQLTPQELHFLPYHL